MREISPAIGMSVDEWMDLAVPPEIKGLIEEIRRQKRQGERKHPSASLIDRSTLLTKGDRERLLDKIAALVDENYVGRSEMCLQFASLVDRALTHLSFPSRAVVGTAIYYDPNGRETFRWRHAWVRVGNEAIDGNVDCLSENPLVPKSVEVAPYWGPISEVPADRFLREHHGEAVPSDVDVDDPWWPELKAWIDVEMLKKHPNS